MDRIHRHGHGRSRCPSRQAQEREREREHATVSHALRSRTPSTHNHCDCKGRWATKRLLISIRTEPPRSDASEPSWRPSVQRPAPLQPCHIFRHESRPALLQTTVPRGLRPGRTGTVPAGPAGDRPGPARGADHGNFGGTGAGTTPAAGAARPGHLRRLHPRPRRWPPDRIARSARTEKPATAGGHRPS